MSKGNISDLKHGREVWKSLERVSYSRSTSQVFSDWLDLMLNAYLSLTDNLSRPNFEDKFITQKLDGVYEDRYMEIVKRCADEQPKGKRAIDHLASATTALVKATTLSEADVLGEIYMAMITFGEHGQFFTPDAVTKLMAGIVGIEDGETVNDPSCGSGGTLIEAGKRNPSALLSGCDLDPRCAKMCVLNMYMFNLNATIVWGNTLSMEYYTEWRIAKGGLIWERDVPKVERQATPKPRQEELFAA